MRAEAHQPALDAAGDSMSGEIPTPPPRTRAERFLTYAKGLGLLLPALGGLVMGVLGLWKGGDAQQAGDEIWVKLRSQVNAQSKVINRLHLRMVAFQARQEGTTSARLMAKLEALQGRYDALVAQTKAKGSGGAGARLGALVKDLELEKLRRKRLEAKLLRPKAAKAAKPPPLQQLPAQYRKAK